MQPHTRTLCVSGSYRLLIKDENNFSPYTPCQVSKRYKRNETASDCEIANTRMGSTERRSDAWQPRFMTKTPTKPVSLRKVLKAFSVGIFSHVSGRGRIHFQMGENYRLEHDIFNFLQWSSVLLHRMNGAVTLPAITEITIALPTAHRKHMYLFNK